MVPSLPFCPPPLCCGLPFPVIFSLPFPCAFFLCVASSLAQPGMGGMGGAGGMDMAKMMAGMGGMGGMGGGGMVGQHNAPSHQQRPLPTSSLLSPHHCR